VPAPSIFVPITSSWEVALLARRGKLRFSIPIDTWLEQATAVPGLEVVPLSLSIISTAVGLDRLRDPADQSIAATALELGAKLATSDVRLPFSRRTRRAGWARSS
jgi:PIN domain nuclease of toxin-antitoxin system